MAVGREWACGPVQVRVPATSANLGPGFDSLGLALTLHDVVTAEVTDGGLLVEVSGFGEETAGLGEAHLVVHAMRAAFGRSAASRRGSGCAASTRYRTGSAWARRPPRTWRG